MAKKRKPPLILPKVHITGVADKGKGVGRGEDGRVIFVERVAPGDIVDVRVVKKKKDFMMGYPTHYHQLSEDRVPPFCEHFNVCGGCCWQHVTYESQVYHKELVVRNALMRIGRIEVAEFLPIISCQQTTYYRNKLEFTFSNKKWLTTEEIDSDISNEVDVLGFHRPRAFDKIVDIDHCWLQGGPSNELRNSVKAIAIEQSLPFFNIKNPAGLMRHIMIRTTSLGEVMLIVSFFELDEPKIKKFLDAVLEKFPQLTTLIYCINSKKNDFVLDLKMNCYFGKGYIEEYLKHVRFRIGPKSFFQTNPKQAEVLYDLVLDFADLTGQEIVYDIYTGIGSIALYIAKDCKQVVGIEEVPEAIIDAKENAELNGITNCVFYTGDVKEMLSEEFAKEHGKPDLLITDPPRAGMHQKVVKIILELEAPKIVYVSCNPATQARDLNLLNEKYDVLKIRPVDMFPHTHHIETVALLRLRTA